MSEKITIHENESVAGEVHYETDRKLTFRHNNINYSGLITETDDPRILEVEINGRSYPVHIQSDLDVLIEKMGLNELVTKDSGDIYSPMPGLVVDTLVQEGQLVDADSPLIILEAMKMENIIKANGAGIIEEIKVQKGEKIDKGQLLIVIKSEE